VFHFYYRVIPKLDITGRVGYLVGFRQDAGSLLGQSISTGFNLLPIWAGARYFFMENGAGVYGAAEIGLNVLIPTTSADGTAPDSRARLGVNVGVGYVISKELPIDLRVQFTMYNLLFKNGADAALLQVDEPNYFGIGLSAGYTFQL